MSEVQKYPEWRQLMSQIQPLLENGRRDFTYEELKELSGIDITTFKGRGQFYQFRRRALKEWQLWFECVPGVGYSVVPPGKQPVAAIKRVGYARKKVGMARAINELVRIEEMTPAQRLLQAQTAVLLHDLSQTFYKAGRSFAAAASSLHLDVSPDDLKRIGDQRKKSKPPDSEDQTKPN